MKIMISSHGQQFGPYQINEVKEFIRKGTFVISDLGWHEGLPSWVPLSDLPFLLGAVSSTRHPMPSAVPYKIEYPPPPQISQETSTSVLAVAALVLSLFSAAITPIPSLVCGHMALSEIRRNPSLGGAGMAKAGLFISYFFVIVCLLVVLSFFGFFAWLVSLN